MKFQSIQRLLFILALAVMTVIFLWLIHPYLMAIFWAIVLTLLFYPLRNWYTRLIGNKPLWGTLLTMLTMCAILFLPLYLLSISLINEFTHIYAAITTHQTKLIDSVTVIDKYLPVFDTLNTFGITNDDIKIKMTQSLGSITSYVAGGLAQLGQQTFGFIVQVFVSLYVLFFFLKDGEILLKKLQHLLPLGDKRERRLYDRFASTVRATMKGTLIIGLLQGAVGAILFWLVGISAAIIWGSVMALLSIIPAVGSFIIWGPAGILFILTGQIWEGVVVLVIGSVVISNLDNVLRPLLVGKDTEMPDVLILLSTLGGLSVFGISGFVIGPVVAAFFLSLWTMFGEDYAKDLKLFG